MALRVASADEDVALKIVFLESTRAALLRTRTAGFESGVVAAPVEERHQQLVAEIPPQLVAEEPPVPIPVVMGATLGLRRGRHRSWALERPSGQRLPMVQGLPWTHLMAKVNPKVERP